MILEKITQDELALYEILKNPVLCSEFIFNFDKLSHEEPFIFTDYQREMLCDFNNYVSIRTARSVGKTVSEVSLIQWILIMNIFPNDYILYTVPNKVHLDPVFTGLIKSFRGNSLLQHFISPNTGINSSDFRITLLNSATLLCRIAGQTGSGANVVGLHTPFELLDESGYYPWATWIELQPTLNTFTPGFRRVVAGVPSGIRENNVNYYADMEDSSYSKHRLSAFRNPRFTKEDDERAVVQYGGRESEDYVHLILGEHGKPVFTLFDRSNFEIGNYPVYKLTLDGNKLENDIDAYYNKLNLLPDLESRTKCIFGIDLGFTEPTAIIILTMDEHDRLRFRFRIRLNQVNYFIQEKIIDMLDSKFNPSIIGIDEGAAGKSVVPTLREHENYSFKNYMERIIPINFSSQVSLGMSSEGEEIKSKTKPFAVTVLQDYSNSHRIVYSSTDLEMITELERMTYTKTPSGELIYKTLTEKGGKKGEDHFTSALLCGALAFYLLNESLDFRGKRKRLARAFWNK